MVKFIERLRKHWTSVSGALLLGAVGCAAPHGSTEGDPILGNFNRPIVTTPPIFSGGLGPDTPAYDGGARIGLPSPDVPYDMGGYTKLSGGFTGIFTPAGSGSPVLMGSSGFFGGFRLPFIRSENPTMRPTSVPTGPRLPAVGGPDAGLKLPQIPQSWSGIPSPDAVTARSPSPTVRLTSGAAMVPDAPPTTGTIQQVRYDRLRDSVQVNTVEEAQDMLKAMGVRWQRLEQIENGTWLFTCVVGNEASGEQFRRFEARGVERMEAVRGVLNQIRDAR